MKVREKGDENKRREKNKRGREEKEIQTEDIIDF